jgi:hypothetical protein
MTHVRGSLREGIDQTRIDMALVNDKRMARKSEPHAVDYYVRSRLEAMSFSLKI